jgi:drug/metabolite transporter (DMT)-like permease
MDVHDKHPPSPPSVPSAAQGRLFIALAAVLWSTSGAFTKLLTKDTSLHLNDPVLPGLVIAFYRALFAGLALLPALRPRDISFRWAMVATALCFAVMNALYVVAMAIGSAANAVLLQYTAPMWMYLASVYWLGEPADRRSSVALIAGLAGIGIILYGGWQSAQVATIVIALGSGLAYAGVILGLRVLRDASPRWLTVVNHLTGALVLLPFVLFYVNKTPSWTQLGVMFVFGSTQMALPYWLAARGLRAVSPQEAGTITLLEPLLNPLWAYLVSPQSETPSAYTLAGGACIVGALAWRYWPRRKAKQSAV